MSRHPAIARIVSALLCLVQGCALVDAHLAPDFASRAPRTIAILSAQSNVGDGAGAGPLADASATELETRGYEVIRAIETDALMGGSAVGSSPEQLAAQLGTDAALSITVLRWDYRARVQSTDYAVAAGFRLVGADGTELWRVDEYSEALSRDAGQGTPSVLANDELERLAARLVARVFDTLPAGAALPKE